MKTKKIAAVSASALAVGMAHGSIVYTYTNAVEVAATTTTANTVTIDLNQDGFPDFSLSFDNNNPEKPYVDTAIGLGPTSPTLSYVLANPTPSAKTEYGFPVTPFGTPINSTYQAEEARGYFNQDDGGNVIGSWGEKNQAYVGLELIDGSGNTYFGWAQFVYNSTNVYNGVTGTLQLIDYAMETNPATNTAVGIMAGQTAEPGDPPALPYPPVSQIVPGGSTAQFSAHGTGYPAPTYQWAMSVGGGAFVNLSDGGNISGSLTSTLTISNATVASEAEFEVTVSDPNGTITSSPVSLTVVPLVITGPIPALPRYYSGESANLAVSVASGVSVTYQWLKNGNPLTDGGNIAGSQTSILSISSLSSADVAGYSVLVTNVYGARTSSVAPLTLVAAASPYEKAVRQLNPVVYYTLNETNDPASGTVTAFDYASGLDGTYGALVENGNPTNAAVAGPRPVPDGFLGFAATNSAMWVGLPKETASFINIPPLNLNTNDGQVHVSFALWFNPTNAGEPAWADLMSFRDAVSGTANGPNYNANGNLGYHWNDNGNTYNFDTGILPPLDQWSFYVITIAPTNTEFYLFNAQEMTNVSAVFTSYTQPPQPLNTPGMIGGDSYDPNFIGAIDEVAVFNQVLTGQQVTNLFNVALTGTNLITSPTKVTLSIQLIGSNASVSWQPASAGGTLYEATSLAGPWTSDGTANPFVEAATGSEKFYKIGN